MVGSGFADKIMTVREGFYFIELCFLEVVDCLDVGLHAVGTGEYGVMPLAWQGFDGFCVGRRFSSVPRANVFAAIISLTYR